MFYLKMAQTEVPLKKYFGIQERCAIDGSYYDKNTVIKKATPVTVTTQNNRQEAEKKLAEKVNVICEVVKDSKYEITEYFITNDSGEVTDKDVLSDYIIITGGERYSVSDVKKMVQLLEYLGYYTRLASVIAYVRYGFLKKVDKSEKSVIYYKDERQKAYFDENDEIVHEYLYGKKKEETP